MAAKTVNEMIDRYGARYALTCGLYNYFPVMNGLSHIFFVDGSQGDDAALGLGQTPEAPLKSITKALSYCSDWSGITRSNEYIFVLGYYQASTEVWPIVINKSHVHIIGVYNSYASGPSWIQATGDKAAIEIATGADGLELANLEPGSKTGYPGIHVTGNAVWGVHIHHCRFGMENGMVVNNGIMLGGSGNFSEMINWVIEDCRFGDKIEDTGIYVPTSGIGPNVVPGTEIRNNIFRVADAAIGINVASTTANFQDGGIFDNKFSVVYNTKGAAITFGEGTKGMIDGNHVVGKDTSTLITVGTNRSIWIGTSGNGAASWGLNYLSGKPCIAESDYEE
jgi:hypothetical protein